MTNNFFSSQPNHCFVSCRLCLLVHNHTLQWLKWSEKKSIVMSWTNFFLFNLFLPPSFPLCYTPRNVWNGHKNVPNCNGGAPRQKGQGGGGQATTKKKVNWVCLLSNERRRHISHSTAKRSLFFFLPNFEHCLCYLFFSPNHARRGWRRRRKKKRQNLCAVLGALRERTKKQREASSENAHFQGNLMLPPSLAPSLALKFSEYSTPSFPILSPFFQNIFFHPTQFFCLLWWADLLSEIIRGSLIFLLSLSLSLRRSWRKIMPLTPLYLT